MLEQQGPIQSTATAATRLLQSACKRVYRKGLPAEGWIQAAHHACLAACSCHLARVSDVNAKHLDWRHLQADKWRLLCMCNRISNQLQGWWCPSIRCCNQSAQPKPRGMRLHVANG
jgi:hypothetical protein